MKKNKKIFYWLSCILFSACTTQTPLSVSPPNQSRSPDESAWSQFVNVEVQNPHVVSTGGGVWLGDGKVLTAAHLFFEMQSASDPVLVIWHGQRIRAHILLIGESADNDLALLQIDSQAVPVALRKVSPAQVCTAQEAAGNEVFVAVRNSIYRTHTSPTSMLMFHGQTWSNSITAVVSHGVSGSPLYNSSSGCLAGIISRAEMNSFSGSDGNEHAACVNATVRMDDAHNGDTCYIEPRTVFMSSEKLRTFLKEASTAQKANLVN